MAKKKEKAAELTAQELLAKCLELDKQLFEYRSLQAINKLEKSHLIRVARKDKARVLTLLTKQKLSSKGVA